MVQRFKQEDLADGFIIDGALRAVEEVQGFQAMLDEAGRSMPVTNIFLRIPGWMGVDRILKNAKNDRNRTDDTPDAILSRLSHFYHDLGKRASLIERQPNWRLLHIDGTGNIDETYDKVLNALV
jgi:adenylate kinase family enzyme